MNTRWRTAITYSVGIALTVSSFGSSVFAEENAARYADEFFALENVYAHTFGTDTRVAGIAQEALPSNPLSSTTTNDGWLEARLLLSSETAPTTIAAESSSQSIAVRRSRATSQMPFEVSFGETSDSTLFKSLGVGLFLASGADVATTEIALSRTGFQELNPIQRNRGIRLSTHVAAPALVWWVSDRVHQAGKPKLALFMRIGFAVAYSYAVMHNTRTMNGVP